MYRDNAYIRRLMGLQTLQSTNIERLYLHKQPSSWSTVVPRSYRHHGRYL